MNKSLNVDWDYTSLAGTYDKRVDYSDKAIDFLCDVSGLRAGSRVVDVGSGTGKLAKLLLGKDFVVDSVEPNEAMRSFGEKNTAGGTIEWFTGTGENTGRPDHVYDLSTFGSSFNVVDRNKALSEVQRIVVPEGWFSCMWNHRDLKDSLQQEIEGIILAKIPDYSYGTRREDQTEFLNDTGLFSSLDSGEFAFNVTMPKDDFIAAWRSHGTLMRQANDKFMGIIEDIDRYIGSQSTVEIPYVTDIWVARLAR